ncbi:MAG TPA: NAD(P)/FAD-dependent oxidoreductase [Mycobacterium sp.]|nr:NAD(P)/FAD-dependent oxidoreductase [Mycobacterium sp.]
MSERYQVLVVGGGFGGLSVTKALAHADVDVTIVDRTNHHLFQPLLYQVATGILSEGVIAPPLRAVVKNQANARAVLAEATRFDLDAKTVYGVSPDGRALQRRYDTLVVAGGATHAYFGHDEWAAFAPGMKTLEDARRLRSRILSAFEMAETVADPEQRTAFLTFVVIGAGPTGVELVGQVVELAKRVLPREFRWVDTDRETRVVLVEAAPTVLGPFDPRLQRYTQRRLAKMGVEVRVDTAATAMTDESITVKGPKGEETIASRTKIWAAGVQASPLAKMLAQATGAQTDRAGRIAVLPDCTLPGHPEVFAIGDMVSLNGLPGVAQPAMQEGKYVGKVIRARLKGNSTVAPFKYFDKGSMATIGRNSAVAHAFGMRFTGPLGYLMWGFIHVLYLIGWGNRIITLFSWMRSLSFTHHRGERVITVEQAHDELTRAATRPHPDELNRVLRKQA